MDYIEKEREISEVATTLGCFSSKPNLPALAGSGSVGDGSGMYHPNFCCILPQGLNAMLANSKKHYAERETPDNVLPLGVHYSGRAGFKEVPDFMSDFIEWHGRMDLLTDRVYREILRKIR